MIKHYPFPSRYVRSGEHTAGSNLFFSCGDFNNISSPQIHSDLGYYEALSPIIMLPYGKCLNYSALIPTDERFSSLTHTVCRRDPDLGVWRQNLNAPTFQLHSPEMARDALLNHIHMFKKAIRGQGARAPGFGLSIKTF